MPLYKYVTAERIDVLQNGLIRFSQPSALNDPWDMRPHIERVFTDDDLEKHVTAPLRPESDTQVIDYVSQILADFAKSQGINDKSLNEIRKLVSEANDEFPGQLRQLYEVAFAETVDKMKQVVPELVELMPEAMDRAVGVLSLTEKPDHPLMWSHYANNHSGLVLGFDETNEFFRSPRHGQPDDAGGARKVKYSSERPKFDPLIDMSLIDDLTDEDAISFFDKMFFTKSQEWDYEEEWRMIKGLKRADRILELPTENVYLFSIPPSCIVSIILGQRMDSETRQQVIEFSRTDKRYTHVSVFQARSSTDKFAIEIQPYSHRTTKLEVTSSEHR
jgi:Protein of unknown function (DUF2971)